jgi:hypothetical protein
VLIVAFPFTEPYSICSISVLWNTPAVHHVATPVHTATVVPRPRTRSGYPPVSLTDELLKRAVDMDRVDEDIRLADRPASARSSVPLAERGSGTIRPAPNVLRI